MPCDLITTEEAACESGIGKIESQTRLLKLIAQLSCEIADAGGGGGGGTPGGAPGDLQFNSAGVFGGFGDFNSGTGVLTIPGDLLFATDNADDIGALAATRPRTGFFGTSVVSPLFTGNLTGNVTGSSSLNVLKAGDTMTGTLLFSPDNTHDIGAVGATRPRTVYSGTSLISPLFDGTRSALGVTTATSALLANTTAAAAGAQQVSPAIRWTGRGWGTTAPGSQAVDFRMYVLPVQGTTAPLGLLVFGSSLNGGAFSETLSVDTGGFIRFGSTGGNPKIGPNGSTLMILDQTNGAYLCNVGSLNFTSLNAGGFGWNGGGDASGAQDTALKRASAGVVQVNNGTAGTLRDISVRDIFTNDAASLVRTATTLTDFAAAGLGTLGNAPTAGNPTKWIAIVDNGTTRYIPTWT